MFESSVPQVKMGGPKPFRMTAERSKKKQKEALFKGTAGDSPRISCAGGQQTVSPAWLGAGFLCSLV